MIDKKRKITICVGGGREFFYYNGYVLEETPQFLKFKDEKVNGKLIYINKKYVIWYKECLGFE